MMEADPADSSMSTFTRHPITGGNCWENMEKFRRAMSAAIDIKAQGAGRLARHRQIICERTAAEIESCPSKALALGQDNVERTASSFANEWKKLMSRQAVGEICALLRDTSDGTEQMRISQPFAGLLPPGELRRISREASPRLPVPHVQQPEDQHGEENKEAEEYQAALAPLRLERTAPARGGGAA